jgi:hypothetical protein
MNVHGQHFYAREEEFLFKFSSAVTAAMQVLDGSWQPNWTCDDKVRAQRDRLVSTSSLGRLVFDGADVTYVENELASVQIALKSSSRRMVVRIAKRGPQYSASVLKDERLP